MSAVRSVPTQRHVPRWSDVRPLVNPRPVVVDPLRRRLERAHTVGDLREIARRRLPRAVFDYVDGAAESEVGLERARRAYREVHFRPRVLRDVSEVAVRRHLLGRESAMPLVLAPTGLTRLIHHHGERAAARAAAAAGVPYTLSTMSTSSIEDVAEVAPDARRWFQLYLWRDRAAGEELVARAAEAGYDTLVLTVDTPVAGARMRDVRNGLTLPLSIGLRTLADMSRHPTWWLNLLTTAPLEFASLRSWDGTVAELAASLMDPGVTLDDLRELRAVWPGHLVVKGLQHTDDARAAVDAGADAVVVSSHGGRQLDRTTAPLHLLPEISAAVGERAEVYVDSGVMTGADVVAAVGLGARGVLVGRAYLYGLMAGGAAGVARALDILHREMVQTLRLLGVPSIDEVSAEHVKLATP